MACGGETFVVKIAVFVTVVVVAVVPDNLVVERGVEGGVGGEKGKVVMLIEGDEGVLEGLEGENATRPMEVQHLLDEVDEEESVLTLKVTRRRTQL